MLFRSASPNTVQLADVNRDGLLDILTTNDSGTVSVLLNRGGLAFMSFMDYYVGAEPIGTALTDVNQDGRLDLLIANRVNDDISVLLAAP